MNGCKKGVSRNNVSSHLWIRLNKKRSPQTICLIEMKFQNLSQGSVQA